MWRLCNGPRHRPNHTVHSYKPGSTAPSTSLSPERRQPWTESYSPLPRRGSRPYFVKKILTRRALASGYHREMYCKWARNCALLTEEFLVQVFKHNLTRIKELSLDWIGFSDSHCCNIGGANVWVQKQNGGWSIEAGRLGDASSVLAVENMIVLCPDGLWATRLVSACYPNPPGELVWHSYG